jgi:hypothetical protein
MLVSLCMRCFACLPFGLKLVKEPLGDVKKTKEPLSVQRNSFLVCCAQDVSLFDAIFVPFSKVVSTTNSQKLLAEKNF